MKYLILFSIFITLALNVNAQDLDGVKPGISINGMPCLIQNLTFSCTPRTCDTIVIVAGDSVEFCTYQQIFLNTDTAFWMQWQFTGCSNLSDTIRDSYPSQTPVCNSPRWDSAGMFTVEAYYNGVLSAYPNSDCYSFGPSHWFATIVVLPNPSAIPGVAENEEFQLLPNPSDGIFRISSSGQDRVIKVVVTDVSGRIILMTEQSELDLTSCDQGIYYVTVFTVNGSTTTPLSLY